MGGAFAYFLCFGIPQANVVAGSPTGSAPGLDSSHRSHFFGFIREFNSNSLYTRLKVFLMSRVFVQTDPNRTSNRTPSGAWIR